MNAKKTDVLRGIIGIKRIKLVTPARKVAFIIAKSPFVMNVKLKAMSFMGENVLNTTTLAAQTRIKTEDALNVGG